MESMGVVRRYVNILIIIINFPYSTCSRSFLAAASLLLCSFLNVFSVLYICLSHFCACSGMSTCLVLLYTYICTCIWIYVLYIYVRNNNVSAV